MASKGRGNVIRGRGVKGLRVPGESGVEAAFGRSGLGTQTRGHG